MTDCGNRNGLHLLHLYLGGWPHVAICFPSKLGISGTLCSDSNYVQTACSPAQEQQKSLINALDEKLSLFHGKRLQHVRPNASTLLRQSLWTAARDQETATIANRQQWSIIITWVIDWSSTAAEAEALNYIIHIQFSAHLFHNYLRQRNVLTSFSERLRGARNSIKICNFHGMLSSDAAMRCGTLTNDDGR